MTTRHKNWRWLAITGVAVFALTAFVAAACGDDNDDNGDASTPPAASTQVAASPTAAATAAAVETPSGSAGASTIATAEDATLGTILVDADGFTLYTFANDTVGSGASACNGGCATTWPPLTADGEPTAATGVNGELATITRDDGAMQVTYNGAPLYTFANDTAPGDTNGHEVAGIWFAATP